MNRFACTIALCILAMGISAVTLELNSSSAYLHVSKDNPSEIRLSIGLQSMELDETGKVSLPPQLSLNRATQSSSSLVVHLAIASTGDYQCRFTGSTVQTGIRAPVAQDQVPPVVSLSEPYWFRNLRGVDLYISPVQIQDGELAIYKSLDIDIKRQGPSEETAYTYGDTKLNPYFVDLYKQHFLNFEPRYEDIAEFGTMAVICPSTSYDEEIQRFPSLIQPWVDWKNQLGIPTQLYSTNTAGSTYEEIRDFIRGLYEADPNLTYVQLVGDYNVIPCLVTTISGNTGGMDAFYSLMQDDDWYPDIFVGRFSAETAADLYTQVKRSLDYEKGIVSGDWLSKAAGVCSSNPPIPGDDDEHNWEHLDNLRAQLLNYGYTEVDRIYANEGADTQDLVNCLNAGKSLLNYCGEGYPSHWVAPEFGIAEVESLSNYGMLPFIHSVSCWTGQFYNGTCLAEALMRSCDAYAEEAKGAIAIYAAAPEQGVFPPMEAQDHTVELLVTDSKHSIGGLCYNGSCSMIDAYGEAGAYNFLAWNLFGDPSLILRTKPAEEIHAEIPIVLLSGTIHFRIDTGEPNILVSISQDNVTLGSGFSHANGIADVYCSEQLQNGETYLLSLSGFNRIPIQKSLKCYNYLTGHEAILEMEVLDTAQFIEPEMEIVKTIRIRNVGQGASQEENVTLSPGPEMFSIVPVIRSQIIAPILPGEETTTSLSFKVNKGIPDLTTVYYSIRLSSASSYDFHEVVHAPKPVLDSVTRSPQINWINPGDTFSLTYRISNQGTADLRDISGILSVEPDLFQVVPQNGSPLSILPGGSGEIVYSVTVPSGCPANTSFSSTLLLDGANAFDEWIDTWIVIGEDQIAESFETGDPYAFPWRFPHDQWTTVTNACDGLYGLSSQSTAADSVWLELDFYALEDGFLEFRYNLYKQYDCDESWCFEINGVTMADLEGYSVWTRMIFPVKEGENTLRWVGFRNPAFERINGSLKLDLIQFPGRSIFENAGLLIEPEMIQITLSPGEICSIPVSLTSADGKFIQYSALLTDSNKVEDRTDELQVSCNKSTFEAGTEEWFQICLYNSNPPVTVTDFELFLPEQVQATQVSGFVMPGAVSLPFDGFGELSYILRWSNPSGSTADSLRARVKLVTDISLTALELSYRLTGSDSSGLPVLLEGTIPLLSSDISSECAGLSGAEGEILDTETGVISLTVNQNLMETDAASYILSIFFNGTRRMNIPVQISYDSDPPGFYDTLHLSCYPNPCSGSTTFAYAVPRDGRAELTIYNLRGQRVKTLVNSELGKGYYRTGWDATDEHGRAVGSGLYFCRLKLPNGKHAAIKCIVIRP